MSTLDCESFLFCLEGVVRVACRFPSSQCTVSYSDDPTPTTPALFLLRSLISFVQIASALPNVMGGVPFPHNFVSFTLPFTSFNLDFLGLLSVSACRLALGFHAQTIVHLSVLPMIGSAICAAYLLVNAVKKPRDARQRAHRRAEVAKILILLTLFLCEFSRCRYNAVRCCFYACSFLFYVSLLMTPPPLPYSSTDPGLATRLFTLLNCASIDGIEGKRFLEADWSVECGHGEHAAMTVVGVAFMLLYILGIPLSMLGLLFKNRKALHDESHPQHEHVVFELGGLFSSYEPHYYYFEVVIILHKCFMTGALVLIGEDSTIQPLVGTLFQMGFMLVVLKLSPYDSDADDLSSFVGSLTLCLTTIGGMVLITRDSTMGGESFDEAFVGSFLIVVMVATVAFNVLMAILSTEVGEKLRKRLCRGGAGKEKARMEAVGSASTRVAPATVGESPGGRAQERALERAGELRRARMKFGADSAEYQAALAK